MNILLAVDSSGSSNLLVAEVASRPWPDGSRFFVLHVVEPALTAPTVVIQKATAAAETLVEDVVKRLKSEGLDATSTIIHGHARSDIVEYAEALNADFVVIGAGGAGVLARFLLGSVAQAVVRSAPCSVEVVRGVAPPSSPREAMKILLATDGSARSQVAARSIAARPWPKGSKVRVLSTVDLLSPPIEPWYLDPQLIEQFRTEAEQRAQQAIQKGQTLLASTALTVNTATFPGDPKAVIVDDAKAWGADLVVVGSHGRRGLTRMLMGSVAEAVVTHAHCSVEVIRKTGKLNAD